MPSGKNFIGYTVDSDGTAYAKYLEWNEEYHDFPSIHDYQRYTTEKVGKIKPSMVARSLKDLKLMLDVETSSDA